MKDMHALVKALIIYSVLDFLEAKPRWILVQVIHGG